LLASISILRLVEAIEYKGVDYMPRYKYSSDKLLKEFKDSNGRKYKVEYIYGFDSISISSQQKDGKYKQLNANKGKGARLLSKYAPEHYFR
jgi:hypothetical protein